MFDRLRNAGRALVGGSGRPATAPPDAPEPTGDRRVRQAEAEVERLDARKAELLERRRALQRELGPRYDRESVSLGRVEKTNGTPSFVAGVRMMQRIHRRAEQPAHGMDGAGAVFADPERTARFARTHDVPPEGAEAPGPADRTVLVHAFHGTVGLVEVGTGGAARHVDGDGTDLGDVRAALPHDAGIELPGALATLVAWSATLSDHVCRPYVQVVWRQDGDRLVLDRLDVDPERVPVLTEEQDVRLGHLFDAGHARMLVQPYLAGALDNRVPDGVFVLDPQPVPGTSR